MQYQQSLQKLLLMLMLAVESTPVKATQHQQLLLLLMLILVLAFESTLFLGILHPMSNARARLIRLFRSAKISFAYCSK